MHSKSEHMLNKETRPCHPGDFYLNTSGSEQAGQRTQNGKARSKQVASQNCCEPNRGRTRAPSVPPDF
jgi:hypothetical protein